MKELFAVALGISMSWKVSMLQVFRGGLALTLMLVRRAAELALHARTG